MGCSRADRIILCNQMSNYSLPVGGGKKIQQVLSSAGILEKFLSKEDVQKVRRCFAGLYEVNDDSIAAAIENPEHFVLKPQREGGGNNFYGQDIPKKLKQMSSLERGAYILMQRIFPPAQNSILLAKGGQIKSSKALSELGIYGDLFRRWYY